MPLTMTMSIDAEDPFVPAPGGAEPDSGPVRRCIVSGVVDRPDGMIRFVVGPEDTVFPDVAEDLPGRGMWVRADAAVLAKAVAKNAFSRAARRAVRVPDDLVGSVSAALTRRCLDAASLARRAGQVISGFERAVEALQTDPDRWAVVIEALDATDNARRKMRGPAGDRPVVRFGTGADLGAVLGRERCVHACVARGGLADRLVRDAARRDGLIPADDRRDSEWANGHE